jgi:hypothetical protein
MSKATLLRRFKVTPRRTYWVEHPDGGGHWASNWEMNKEPVAKPVGVPPRKELN